MARAADITPRQYEVLDIFYRRHVYGKKRPHIGDLRKALGITSRAGVYCAHLVPLLAKGYLDRDLPPFERRGYYLTRRGVLAVKLWRQRNAQSTEQSAVDSGDSAGGEVPQDGREAAE